MEIQLNIAFLIISFIASLTVFIWRPTPIYLRLFPLFLSISGIVQIIAIRLALSHHTNVVVYNFNSVYEFCFFLFVFHQIIFTPRVKRIIFILTCIYALFAMINIIFIQKPNNWNSVSYSFGGLLIIVFSIYYFLELFRLPKSINLRKAPEFWICTGLLFFYAGTFPFFGLVNFLSNMPDFVVRNTSFIVTFLNLVLHSFLSVAFLCRFKASKMKKVA